MPDTPFRTTDPSPGPAPGTELLRLSSLTSDATASVALTGDLDVATVPQLDDALRRAQADATTVVVDLRGLRFIGAGGVELMLATEDRIRQAGGRLILVRGAAECERLFALVALEDRLELVDQPPAEILAAA